MAVDNETDSDDLQEVAEVEDIEAEDMKRSDADEGIESPK